MSLRHRVAALFATYFFGLGLFLPYFPIVLEEAGLSPAEIGTALAVPLAVRLVANPLISAAADRFAPPGIALSLMAGLSALGFASLALVSGFWTIALVLGATSLAWGPIVPISDALAARVDRDGHGDYGRMRLWGSIAFILANLVGGAFVGASTSPVVLGGIVLGLVMLSVFALGVRVDRVRDDAIAPTTAKQAAATTHQQTLRVLRQPAFLLVLFAAGCVQASHAAYYGFSAIYWSQATLSGFAIGAMWGLGVVTEIFLFAASSRLNVRLGAIGLLVLGAIAGIIRWFLFPFALDPISIAALQLLHGISFGATHLGAVAYVASNAPARWAGAAQGMASTVAGGLTAVASAIAGVLYAQSADLAFFAMAALSALGVAALLVGLLAARAR